jgi:hypothetical protein
MSQEVQTDLNRDGTVTTEELSSVSAYEKSDAQKHMAWVSLVAMLIFTGFLFLPYVPDSRITILSDISGLFYVAQASIVGAYMGVTAYMSRR